MYRVSQKTLLKEKLITLLRSVFFWDTWYMYSRRCKIQYTFSKTIKIFYKKVTKFAFHDYSLSGVASIKIRGNSKFSFFIYILASTNDIADS